MANKKVNGLVIQSMESIFGLDESTEGVSSAFGEVREIPLTELYEFKNHPFHESACKDLDEMVVSIKEHGVIIPGICRVRPQGGYEIIAGHRRKNACELAGKKTIPMVIRNLSDDEAIISMVDTNIQRESIIPSERAKALKMKYEAIKHQGKKGNSLLGISKDTGLNVKAIQRYIKLADLSDDLLKLVDKGKIGLVPGVALSYLSEEEQKWLIDVIDKLGKVPSVSQAEELKALSQAGELSEDKMYEMIKPKNLCKKRKIKIKSEKLDEYFSPDYSDDEIAHIIIELLEKWKGE